MSPFIQYSYMIVTCNHTSIIAIHLWSIAMFHSVLDTIYIYLNIYDQYFVYSSEDSDSLTNKTKSKSEIDENDIKLQHMKR